MSMNRRDFMRLACATGVAGVASRTRAEPIQRISPDWMGVLTDLTLCVGCRKCEWACKEANGLPNQAPLDAYDDKSVFERKRRTDAENLTVVNRYPAAEPGGNPVHVKTQCMHCCEPACASACLVAAFRKASEGPVLYSDKHCLGCRYCMVACPFNVPAYTYDNPTSPVVRKCTMCFKRITEGGGVPACAAMCPVEALTFGKRTDLIALAHHKIASSPGKYIDHVYGEHEVGGTNWLYIADRPFDQLGFRTDLGTSPYPELTKGLDAAIPLILTAWPALLMGARAFTKRREELARAERQTEAAATNRNREHD